MAKDDTRKTDQSPTEDETKRRRGAGDIGKATADTAEAALDEAVHATTGVMQATTDVMTNGAQTARDAGDQAARGAKAGADQIGRAMQAGREAAAGLAAMAEAPTARSVTGAAFPPALTGSAGEVAGKAGRAATDQLQAVGTELSDQLASLMEDNAALFEQLTSARGLPEMVGAYQSWAMRRMSRAAGLQMAVWNTWMRSAQFAASSSQAQPSGQDRR